MKEFLLPFLFKLCQKINTEAVVLVNVQKYTADRDNTDKWKYEQSYELSNINKDYKKTQRT